MWVAKPVCGSAGALLFESVNKCCLSTCHCEHYTSVVGVYRQETPVVALSDIDKCSVHPAQCSYSGAVTFILSCRSSYSSVVGLCVHLALVFPSVYWFIYFYLFLFFFCFVTCTSQQGDIWDRQRAARQSHRRCCCPWWTVNITGRSSSNCKHSCN